MISTTNHSWSCFGTENTVSPSSASRLFGFYIDHMSCSPASFVSLRPNFPTTFGSALFPIFVFQLAMISCLVLMCDQFLIEYLHKSFQVHLLQYQYLKHRTEWWLCRQVFHSLIDINCSDLALQPLTAHATTCLNIRATPEQNPFQQFEWKYCIPLQSTTVC